MNVIPVFNCPDVACVQKKIAVAKLFLLDGDIVHLDVADGSFTEHKTWNDPLAWVKLKSPFALEVHLMVEHPEEHADNWLAAGAQRLIVHVESITQESLHEIVSAAKKYNVQVMLSSKPETPNEELLPYLKEFTEFQVLAVSPGASGQTFLPFMEEKIRFLREEVPNAIIEVDGGMNDVTSKLVRSFGADTIVSSSYIFGAQDPKAAYESLKNI